MLLALLFLAAPSEPIHGQVVRVSDGDTLTLLTAAKQELKVRLAEIDAPEKRQPFGNRSKQSLSELVFGKQVIVRAQSRDRYGRTVGRVFVGALDVNAEQLRRGLAWVYRTYSKDRSLLLLEQQAKARKIGLWSHAGAQPPWCFRRPKHCETTGQSNMGSKCGSKRRCSQMATCAEARHYLRVCRVSTLDGDGDGVPCEALCR